VIENVQQIRFGLFRPTQLKAGDLFAEQACALPRRLLK
jgi:hypothetical protein